MELGNIVFVVAFIVLPVVIGIWALLTRRQLTRQPAPDEEYLREAYPEPEQRTTVASESPTEALPSVDRAANETPTEVLPGVQAEASTAAEQTRVVQRVPDSDRIEHRPFYPPRFAGRSAGVVRRQTPPEHQRLIRRR